MMPNPTNKSSSEPLLCGFHGGFLRLLAYWALTLAALGGAGLAAAEPAPTPRNPAEAKPADGSVALGNAAAIEAGLKQALRAAEVELQRMREENTRLKEDLKQAALEISSLNAQIRLIEKSAGVRTATGAAPAPVEAKQPKGESLEELRQRIAVLQHTVQILTEESRQRSLRKDVPAAR